jgi:diguanylate cyclase (GGDEF)-like protein
LPPFFIPILAFAIWVLSVFSYFPVMKFNLFLADQIIAPQFFISALILVFAWAFSGAVTAVVLSVLSALIALYIGLGTKEPALFLQALIYGALFLFIVSYLQRIQKKTNDKKIIKENFLEKINLAEQEILAKNTKKEALEIKIHRLLNLQRFSEELKETPDISKLSERIVREVKDSLGHTHECALYLVNEDKEELYFAAASGYADEALIVSKATIYDQWVMKKTHGIVIEDTRNDYRFHADLRSGPAVRRSICASPLLSENRVLGVLRLSAPEPKVFHADDLRLLDIFAGIGAVNLRNILLYQKMQELALRDSLTGLYVNRYFMERVASEIEKSAFSKSHFSVILLDIDYFKRYNDDYGHVVGDIVLRNIAAIILDAVGNEGLVARYGGEEFAVLLPGKDKNTALAVAEKIRGEIEKAKFSLRRAEGNVTASLGVAMYPAEGRTREEILWKSDQHLYHAKHSGRNRVCGSI